MTSGSDDTSGSGFGPQKSLSASPIGMQQTIRSTRLVQRYRVEGGMATGSGCAESCAEKEGFG